MLAPLALGLCLLCPPAQAADDTGAGDCDTALAESCDLDGDGVMALYCQPVGGDCNDCDPEVHPGATERLGDGVDQDCDGLDSLDDHLELSGGTGTCAAVGAHELATIALSLLLVSWRRRS